jgi:uncharacterized protein (TIGR02118 family)
LRGKTKFLSESGARDMIKVSVLYPNEDGKKFDHGYFTTTHLDLVQNLLTPAGLVKAEMEKGVSGADPSSPAPFVALVHLHFNSVDEVHAGFTTHGGAIMGDIANYTDIKPQIQISESLV